MATDLVEKGATVSGRAELFAQQRWSQVLAQYIPGSVDGFFVIVRRFAGNAFPPIGDAFALQLHQQNSPLGGSSEARLEKMDERHLNFLQRDGLDSHGSVFLDRGYRGHSLLHVASRVRPIFVPAA